MSEGSTHIVKLNSVNWDMEERTIANLLYLIIHVSCNFGQRWLSNIVFFWKGPLKRISSDRFLKKSSLRQ